MNENYSQANAMSLTNENPFYVKFINHLEKKRIKNEKKESANSNFINTTEKTPDEQLSFEEKYNTKGVEEYEYLLFITKKYFRDKVIICLLKFTIGILAIVLASFIEDFRPMNQKAKGPIMVFLFMYGLIMIPLSFLYTVVSLHCLIHYKNFVSTRTSIIAKQIIRFYDPETDKLQEVNWKNSISNVVSAGREQRRIRGW